MLNNKGFVVSAVLYTLLIAFLLFLGATLASFSSSNSIISNANKDLVDGTNFKAEQVKPNGTCENNNDWYHTSSLNENNETIQIETNTNIRIYTRYGTMYWPKDFKQNDNNNNLVYKNISDVLKDDFVVLNDFISTKNKNIKVRVFDINTTTNDNPKFKLEITDSATSSHATYTSPINCNTSDSEKSCMGVYDLCK